MYFTWLNYHLNVVINLVLEILMKT
nr:unnamed protein product [Callosobruchus chinensis]